MENVKGIIENVAEKAHEEMTDEQKVHNAIAHVDPSLVLRNLAFWLDIAMAKGRYIDLMQQQSQENAVPTSADNSESEV